MSDRSTKEFETTGSHTVVMYDYITGGEFEQLMQAMQIVPPETSGVTVTAALAANHLAYTLLVRSIDGQTENIVDLIKSLPLADYTDIRNAVEEMTNGDKKK